MASDTTRRLDEEKTHSTGDDTVLDVSGFTKIYPDGTLAVDGINFSINHGDFCVLIGPSGCGKSTTLHSIIGNIEVTDGRVLLDGDDITNTPTYERDISLVFQDFQLFPHLSVRENIRYGLERMEVPEGEMEERVERIVELLKLSELVDRNPNELSAGQKQQVALARSLVLEPKLLLLDEPLGDLDYKLQKHMERELMRIHHELDTTFVYVTHDQTQAMRLADQIVVMNEGKVEQSGTAKEVYDEPSTAFVATFVGDSNTFFGELTGVSGDGSRATVETPFGDFQASTDNLVSSPKDLLGAEIPFSVRPQYLSLSGDKDNELNCDVEDVIHHPGSGTQVVLNVEENEDSKTVMLTTRDLEENPSGEITVSWAAENTILLEEASVVPGVDLEADILGE